MKRNKTLLTVLSICLALGMYACKKNQYATTIEKKIQGRWKLTRIATDNGSGHLAYSPVSPEQDWEWVFNEDGTGYDIQTWNSNGVKENFRYYFTEHDSLWIGTSAHDTTLYYVPLINAENMTLTWSQKNSLGIMVQQGLYFNKN